MEVTLWLIMTPVLYGQSYHQFIEQCLIMLYIILYFTTRLVVKFSAVSNLFSADYYLFYCRPLYKDTIGNAIISQWIPNHNSKCLRCFMGSYRVTQWGNSHFGPTYPRWPRSPPKPAFGPCISQPFLPFKHCNCTNLYYFPWQLIPFTQNLHMSLGSPWNILLLTLNQRPLCFRTEGKTIRGRQRGEELSPNVALDLDVINKEWILHGITLSSQSTSWEVNRLQEAVWNTCPNQHQ